MTQIINNRRLSPEQLTAPIDEKLLSVPEGHEDSEQIFLGHHRAKEALDFALAMEARGFNVYAMGEPGTGRQTLITQMLAAKAANQVTPAEWCYINNFDDVHAPYKLYVSPGDGKQLLTRINTFIDELLDLFPEIFDNPGYQRQKAAIDREFNQKYDEAITIVETTALTNDVVLYEEGGEIGFSPLVDGRPLNDKEFANLDETKRNEFYLLLEKLENLLSEQLIELPLWKRTSSDKLRKLKHETAEQSIRPFIKELEHEFASNLGVLKYLSNVKAHVVDAVLEILVDENAEKQQSDKDARKLMQERFLPNLLVARIPEEGAPVVYEQNPTFQNLFGHVDFSSFQGSSYTSYRLIRPGALHKANGGYLLLEAEKLLNQPLVWGRLKLALKTQQITIENPYSEFAQSSGVSLQPEKIPLNVKVILLGDPEIYYTLQDYDQEFTELFRVLADFDRHLDNNEQNLIEYAQLIRQRGQQRDYPQITDDAVVELIRYALRRAEHQHKISVNIAQVNDLLDEAVYFWQQQSEQSQITSNFVLQALAAKQRRTGRISEAWLNEIKEEQVLISTQGEQIGKVNGLTVLEIGDSVFGTPARITATVYAGSHGITDIEREVDLGRSIHSKGVLLLSGYLGHKYGQGFPVAISANIAIEQSYGHIDGDSASMAELCALVSAISHLPIKQGIAITGSMNQHGEVQSIGGVNEKIEGFYRLCQDKGLTGEQGVIIPKTNMINLMLSPEVIAAVEAEQFHIYAVENVDQALEILTGQMAGAANSVGRYPRKSIHGIVLDKLAKLSDLLNGEEEDA
ncbi:ATP-dependent protease [Thalassotalea insulae]|uniref:endopeptidase La n=1 Tax=Thalassotalea insulae TaxID=2056778 RepID=A0ABQ6GNR3_9GAMM|nr:ATP-binding protein [Thalassotalea insulae]GLX77516.1 ATP-dependent protease [Thalassotalea insulae]